MALVRVTRQTTRRGGSITGAGRPIWATAAAYWVRTRTLTVGGGAPRSFSLAFLVPLRSDRGSLTRSRQLLILIIASVFACGPVRYRSSGHHGCQAPDPDISKSQRVERSTRRAALRGGRGSVERTSWAMRTSMVGGDPDGALGQHGRTGPVVAANAPAGSAARSGIEDVAQTVADEVEGEHRDQQGDPGGEGEPWRIGEMDGTVADHLAP